MAFALMVIGVLTSTIVIIKVNVRSGFLMEQGLRMKNRDQPEWIKFRLNFHVWIPALMEGWILSP